MTGVPGCARLIRVSSSAMPGTGSREEVYFTSWFQAATNMRGTCETMAVSSMSETTPRRGPGSTTRILVVTVPAPVASMRASCQPALRP